LVPDCRARVPLAGADLWWFLVKMSLRLLRVLLPLALVPIALSKRVKVGDEVDAENTFTLHNMSKATTCEYMPPKTELGADGGGWPEMGDLMKPVEQGEGSTPSSYTRLGYVYGPFFKEGAKTSVFTKVTLSRCDKRNGAEVDPYLEPQILALQYDVGGKHVESYFAKPGCPEQTNDKCCDGNGNLPGSISKKFLKPNPSDVYEPNDIVPLGPYGEYKLVSMTAKAGLMYRLQVHPSKTLEACYLDHVYVCSSKEYVAKCQKADGDPCEC